MASEEMETVIINDEENVSNIEVITDSFETVFDTQQRLTGLCRICSLEKEGLLNIFKDEAEEKNISDLINSYLPILVTPDDLLPVTICPDCLGLLVTAHTLVETCLEADKKMKDMLGIYVLQGSIQCDDGQSYEIQSEEIVDEDVLDAEVLEDDVKKNDDDDDDVVFVEEVGAPSITNASNSTQEVTISSENLTQNGTLTGRQKLYRCLHCDVTETDAYLLLSHQLKAHPAHLLKCDRCEFIYSSDQKDKYDEHRKLHSKSNDKENINTTLTSPKKGPKSVLKQPSKSVTIKPKEMPDVEETSKKKQIIWRCAFCGFSSKSKDELASHCATLHREQLLPVPTTSQCFNCKQVFQSKYLPRDHTCSALARILPKPVTQAMPCLSCSLTFLDPEEFRLHLLTHNNSVKCDVCGAHFRTEYNLAAHMKKHDTKPVLKCPQCPRTFTLQSRMRVHMRTHTGELPFMCTKCGKRFSTDSGYRLHMNVHDGKKPYVCASCGRRFNRPSNLRRHEGICGIQKLNKCKVCDEEFPTREDLISHKLTHTKEERDAVQMKKMRKEDKFSCKVCDMKFDKVVELTHHRSESHTVQEIEDAKRAGRNDGGSHVCPECGKEVYNKKSLKVHMLRHGEGSAFKCTVCPNVYSTKFALDYHTLTHTGERPFKCDICSEGFKSSLSLRIHRMKHTGVKPYKCRVCDYSFFTAHSLRLHLVSHSDLRKYSCEYCPATFKRKKTLVNHVRIHTGEKPFACKICGRRFSQKGSCTSHERNHAANPDREKRAPRTVKRKTEETFKSAEDSTSTNRNLPLVGNIQKGMRVAIIKNWKGSEVRPAASMGVLVSQGEGSPALLLTGEKADSEVTGETVEVDGTHHHVYLEDVESSMITVDETPMHIIIESTEEGIESELTIAPEVSMEVEEEVIDDGEQDQD